VSTARFRLSHGRGFGIPQRFQKLRLESLPTQMSIQIAFPVPKKDGAFEQSLLRRSAFILNSECVDKLQVRKQSDVLIITELPHSLVK
jgi:hypothetical protein